jgi:hypothetical protein
MKAPFNNNLPPQTSDVIVNPINPENPDSKTNGCCAHNFQLRQDRWYSVWEEMGTLREYFLYLLVLNQDLQDFEDCRGRLRF